MANNTELRIQIRADGQQAKQELGAAQQDLQRLGEQARAAGQQASQASAGVEQLAASAGRIAVGVVGAQALAGAIQLVAQAVTALPAKAFDYSRELESSAVGMAGILGSMGAVNGRQLEYNSALAVSQQMIRQLGDDALRTAASSQELVATFQALLAPGLAARMTLDEIRQLSVVGTNAVKSLGLSGHQVVQELRDLVQGGITAAGSSLATALGLRDEDIAKAKASSEGLFNFLMGRLKGFEASSEQFGNTLQGRMDALQEGAVRVAAQGMEPLTQSISKAVGELAQLFVQVDKSGQVQLNPQLISSLHDFSEGAAEGMQVGKQAVGVLWEHRDALLTLWAAYKAYAIGQWAAEASRAVAAKMELAQASRLAAVHSAAEAAANEAVVLSNRQKIAAYLDELRANVQRTAAQVASTVGMGAATQAERAHAVAVRQLEAAQNAARISTSAMGTVVGALGGPVGIAIAAVTLLIGKLIDMRSEAERTAKVGQSKERVDAANTQGVAAEARDISRLQAQLEQLKEARDELELDSRGKGGLISKFLKSIVPDDFESGNASQLQQINGQISELESTLARASASSEQAAGSQGRLTLTLAGAEQAWKKSTDGIKTASSIQAEYTEKLQASRAAFAGYLEVARANGVSDAQINKDKKAQAEAEAQLARQRDHAIKSLSDTHAKSAQAMDTERASLQAKLNTERAYGQALSEHGLAATKMTEADKASARYSLLAASAKDSKTAAHYREMAALAASVAALEHQNSGVIESLRATEQQVEAAGRDADAIRERAASLEAENAVWGKSKTAIEEATLATMEQQLREAEGSDRFDPAYIASLQAKVDAQKRYTTAVRESEVKRTDQRLDEWVRQAQEQNALYAQEAQLVGLTALEREKLVAVRQVELKLAKELAEIDRSSVSEVDKERQRAKARAAATLEAQTEVNRVVLNDAIKVNDQIGQSLSDSLMRGFEAGKDAAKSFADGTVNLFKTMVLRPTISAIASPVAGMISSGVNSALGLSGGGGGGLLGTASSAAGIYNAGTGMAGAASGFANGLSAWGAEGSVTGVLSNPGLYSAAELAGAVAPIALAAVALVAIANSMDDSGTYHTGALSSYSAATGAKNSTTHGAFGMGFGGVELGAETQKLTAGIAETIVSALDKTAATFGQKVGYSAATAFADDTSGDGAWGGLLIKLADKTLINWDDTRTSKWAPKEFADGQAGKDQYLAAVASDFKTILQSIDLPAWAKKRLDALGDSATLEQVSAAVDKILGLPEQLLQAFGTSGQALSQQIATDMISGASSQQIGDKFAATIVGGMETALVGNFANQVQNLVTTNMVAPFVDAMLSGSTAAQAVAAMSVESTVQRLQATAGAFKELWGNTDFRAALDEMRATIASVTTGAVSGAGYTQQYAAALLKTEDATKAATDAEREAEAAAKRIADERKRLQDQIDQLTMTRSQLLAKERAALDASNQALFDQLTVLQQQERIRALGADVASRYLSAEEARHRQLMTMAQALQAPLAGIRISAEVQSIAAALNATTKNALREFISSLDLSTQAGRDAAEAVLGVAGALADMRDQAVDNAMSAVERAADADKKRISDAAQAQQDALDAQLESLTTVKDAADEAKQNAKSLFDTLKNGVKDLRAVVDQEQTYATASSAIQQALASAKATGYLPDPEQMSQWVSTITGRLTSDDQSFKYYTNALDANRERLQQADRMQQLQEIAGTQLSTAEQQLAAVKTQTKAIQDQKKTLEEASKAQIAAIDEQVSLAREMVSVLRGQDVSLQSLAASMQALGAALLAAGTGKAPTSGAMIASSGTAYSAAAVAGAVSFVQDRAAAGDIMGIYQAATAQGLSSTDLAAIGQRAGYSVSSTDIQAWAQANGLPAFADGGYHTGGLRMVGEQGIEIEATGPARYFNAGQTQDMLSKALNGGPDDGAILVLHTDLDRIEKSINSLLMRIVDATEITAKTLRSWDNYGMPAARVKPAEVRV